MVVLAARPLGGWNVLSGGMSSMVRGGPTGHRSTTSLAVGRAAVRFSLRSSAIVRILSEAPFCDASLSADAAETKRGRAECGGLTRRRARAKARRHEHPPGGLR